MRATPAEKVSRGGRQIPRGTGSVGLRSTQVAPAIRTVRPRLPGRRRARAERAAEPGPTGGSVRIAPSEDQAAQRPRPAKGPRGFSPLCHSRCPMGTQLDSALPSHGLFGRGVLRPCREKRLSRAVTAAIAGRRSRSQAELDRPATVSRERTSRSLSAARPTREERRGAHAVACNTLWRCSRESPIP